MRLVLQCSSCGTVHTVGTAVCGTCRASGVQNLRLLFECEHCFRLGLNPSCGVCSPVLSLDEDNGSAKPAMEAGTFPPREILNGGKGKDDSKESIPPPKTRDGPDPRTDHDMSEDSDYELTLDELPFAHDDMEGLSLDDETDSVARDK